MQAYSVTLNNNITFLIHGWIDKNKNIVVGKYPSGEVDRINILNYTQIEAEKVNQVNEINYPSFRQSQYCNDTR